MTVSKSISYDDVLTHIGGMGLYQKRLLFLTGLACATKAIHLLMTIFTMGSQDFRCAIPHLANDSYHIQSEAHRRMLNNSIPFDVDKGEYSQCSRYKSLQTDRGVNFTSSLNTSQPEVEQCTQWVYSSDVFATSIVSQFDLVCDRSIYTSHANMMTMAGLLIGSLAGGALSDRFGRKKTFLFLTWLHALTAIALAFVKSVFVFLILRLLLTTASLGFFATACVLCMEVVSSGKRTVAGMITMFGWSAGMFVLVLFAYFIRNWQHLQLVLACPLILVALAFMWLFPESPRWLLSKGRHSEAEVILRTMAKVNKREIPEKMLMADLGATESLATDSNDESHEEDAPKRIQTPEQSVLRVVTSPVLLFRLVVLSCGWLVNSMVYYGLTLNVGSIIEGDIYLNFSIMAAMEVVSYVLLITFLSGPIGRKPVFCTCILLGGIACLSTILPMMLDGSPSWINTVLSNLGKFFITASFAVVWIYTPELLPTQLRQSGLGVCSMFGRIGGIISPYVGSLNKIISGPMGQMLPLFVFGSAAILAGVLALVLPETSNRKLPETIEEAEAMTWRNQKRKSVDEDKSSAC